MPPAKMKSIRQDKRKSALTLACDDVRARVARLSPEDKSLLLSRLFWLAFVEHGPDGPKVDPRRVPSDGAVGALVEVLRDALPEALGGDKSEGA